MEILIQVIKFNIVVVTEKKQRKKHDLQVAGQKQVPLQQENYLI